MKKNKQKRTEILKKQSALEICAITITAVIIALAVEYIIIALGGNFNFPRVVLFAIIVTALCLIYKSRIFKIFDIFYDPSRKNHRIAALLLCFICILIAIIISSIFHTDINQIPYPLNNHIVLYNPYIQQFDAFKKGQLHIDLQPDPRLAELQNPYDPDARTGFYYLWDRAYYDGRYFSYFMIAPILTVYYPHYIIRGTLPSEDFVMQIFTIITALFFSFSVIKWAGDYTKRLPLPILCVGTVAALFSTQVFLISRGFSRFYYIATIAGMAYTALFIFLILYAISAKPGKNRYILLASSGVAYSLVFLSRMNIALLLAFVVVPVIWLKIIKPNLKEKKAIFTELVFLGIPIILTFVFQMWFNNARFSGIFDFGATYQLTVSDISLNRIRILDIFPALFHYFLQPLVFSWDFPFISLHSIATNYSHYVYVDSNFGLFLMPMFWALFGSIKVFLNKNVQGVKLTLASALAGIFAVAWFNFSMAGVIFRYTCDLTLVAAFVSVAIIFYLCENVSENRKHTVFIFTTAFCAVSIFFSLSLALSSNLNLTTYSSNV